MHYRYTPKFRLLTRVNLLTICLVVCAGVTAITVGIGRRFINPSSALTTAPVPQSPGRKSNIEVEAVTLLQWGFEPKEITRPKGQFRLAINNQSQLREELTFSLAIDKGNKVNDVKLHGGGKRRWDGLYDLKPGKYQLTVSGHPEWVCTLNITDK